jgi:TRAP-type mannitol/chloroaromatic compound transport system permease small subunit
MLKAQFDEGITENKPLQLFLTFNDRLQHVLGLILSWLLLAMAIITVTVVVLRYGFNTGTIALQEGLMYLHACVFLMGAGVALGRDSHVRVDIFYQKMSARNRDWVNALGIIVFLLPVSAIIGLSSWSYVHESWVIREVSPEPGGIPAVFILKTLIPLSMLTLCLQGISLLIICGQRLVSGEHHGW